MTHSVLVFVAMQLVWFGLVLLCRCNYSIHSVELILNGGHSLRQIGRFKWSIVSIWSEWVSEQVGKGKEEEEDSKQVPTILFFTHLLVAHDGLPRSKMTVFASKNLCAHTRPLPSDRQSTTTTTQKNNKEYNEGKRHNKRIELTVYVVCRALDSM